uniref:C3H1-type domain-containing protein n=1 Tax=Chromera velia CCMP2878 TaxID=1169474 RepID=A0A0G4I904_9ALVE|eukprot:Cvel_12036.t1-p1 / transcript=Cvel_12036.t1 / gene=Cvel_12036 / organism=Chromera_velia_CCMP2878 / gene_product=hypothetical protein / transcript_product=hypothetical protein / location=Cvel_scaffold773:27414-31415(+) / protein_length=1122 / sequence_SO=supercontig / SO=protein_coding / is_pseudo=false
MGHCSLKDQCRYAHGEEELRPDPVTGKVKSPDEEDADQPQDLGFPPDEQIFKHKQQMQMQHPYNHQPPPPPAPPMKQRPKTHETPQPPPPSRPEETKHAPPSSSFSFSSSNDPPPTDTVLSSSSKMRPDAPDFVFKPRASLSVQSTATSTATGAGAGNGGNNTTQPQANQQIAPASSLTPPPPELSPSMSVPSTVAPPSAGGPEPSESLRLSADKSVPLLDTPPLHPPPTPQNQKQNQNNVTETEKDRHKERKVCSNSSNDNDNEKEEQAIDAVVPPHLRARPLAEGRFPKSGSGLSKSSRGKQRHKNKSVFEPEDATAAPSPPQTAEAYKQPEEPAAAAAAIAGIPCLSSAFQTPPSALTQRKKTLPPTYAPNGNRPAVPPSNFPFPPPPPMMGEQDGGRFAVSQPDRARNQIPLPHHPNVAMPPSADYSHSPHHHHATEYSNSLQRIAPGPPPGFEPEAEEANPPERPHAHPKRSSSEEFLLLSPEEAEREREETAGASRGGDAQGECDRPLVDSDAESERGNGEDRRRVGGGVRLPSSLPASSLVSSSVLPLTGGSLHGAEGGVVSSEKRQRDKGRGGRSNCRGPEGQKKTPKSKQPRGGRAEGGDTDDAESEERGEGNEKETGDAAGGAVSDLREELERVRLQLKKREKQFDRELRMNRNLEARLEKLLLRETQQQKGKGSLKGKDNVKGKRRDEESETETETETDSEGEDVVVRVHSRREHRNHRERQKEKERERGRRHRKGSKKYEKRACRSSSLSSSSSISSRDRSSSLSRSDSSYLSSSSSGEEKERRKEKERGRDRSSRRRRRRSRDQPRHRSRDYLDRIAEENSSSRTRRREKEEKSSFRRKNKDREREKENDTLLPDSLLRLRLSGEEEDVSASHPEWADYIPPLDQSRADRSAHTSAPGVSLSLSDYGWGSSITVPLDGEERGEVVVPLNSLPGVLAPPFGAPRGEEEEGKGRGGGDDFPISPLEDLLPDGLLRPLSPPLEAVVDMGGREMSNEKSDAHRGDLNPFLHATDFCWKASGDLHGPHGGSLKGGEGGTECLPAAAAVVGENSEAGTFARSGGTPVSHFTDGAPTPSSAGAFPAFPNVFTLRRERERQGEEGAGERPACGFAEG